MALVPASPAFAQQGTVDWVSLSQTSFTASFAVLGRLAGAGLEPLTVAMSQAICTMFSISIVGEKRLKDAMATCKAFNSYGEVIWFGIGVRHILRTLVQFTQGASCVALAACLTEGFSPQYSAMVLYEMAKSMKGPSELTPSYTQWLRYVETCSGVLAASTFGKQIDQLSRLSRYASPLHELDSPHNRAVQAKELAEFLCLMGRVQSGQLDAIEVLSGPVSSWAVAFCDSFVSLRVVLYSQDGGVLFQNYDSSTEKPQVAFHTTTASSRDFCLTLKGVVFSLNSGEFVEKWHLPKGETTPSLILLNSRVGWNTIIQDCYGLDASRIFAAGAKNGCSKAFGDLLACCALIYHETTDFVYFEDYQSAEDIVERFSTILSELSYLQSEAKATILAIENSLGSSARLSKPHIKLDKDLEDQFFHRLAGVSSLKRRDSFEEFRDKLQNEKARLDSRRETIWKLHAESVKEIQKHCRCGNHPFRCSTVTMLYTVIVVANLFTNAIIDDGNDLQLSRLGLRALHEEIFDRSYPMDSLNSVRGCLLTGIAISKHVQTPHFAAMFETYLHLFSGYHPSVLFDAQTRPKISAMSSGGFYSYVDYLREPFQSEIQCGRIHIGRGSIQVDGRNYAWVHDQDRERLPMLEAGQNEIMQPRVRALVEENITLRFWYEQWGASTPKWKHSINPMECLAMGWIGNEGAWPGLNMREPHPPTMYTKGLCSTTGSENLNRTGVMPPIAEGSKINKRQRNCGRCRTPGHTVRTCPKDPDYNRRK